jgi:hypothetical protein
VQHLLLDDVDEHPLPGGHRGRLLAAETLVTAALEEQAIGLTDGWRQPDPEALLCRLEVVLGPAVVLGQRRHPALGEASEKPQAPCWLPRLEATS